MPSNEHDRPLILPSEVIKPFIDAYFAAVEKENVQRLDQRKEGTHRQAEKTLEAKTEERD